MRPLNPILKFILENRLQQKLHEQSVGSLIRPRVSEIRPVEIRPEFRASEIKPAEISPLKPLMDAGSKLNFASPEFQGAIGILDKEIEISVNSLANPKLDTVVLDVVNRNSINTSNEILLDKIVELTNSKLKISPKVQAAEISPKSNISIPEIPSETPTEIPTAPKFITKTKVTPTETVPFEFPTVPSPSETSTAIIPQTQQQQSVSPIGALTVFPSFAPDVFKIPRVDSEEEVAPKLKPKPQREKIKTRPRVKTKTFKREELGFGINKEEQKEEPEAIIVQPGEFEETDIQTEFEKLLGKYSGTQRLK